LGADAVLKIKNLAGWGQLPKRREIPGYELTVQFKVADATVSGRSTLLRALPA
jgi:hypothetical protein